MIFNFDTRYIMAITAILFTAVTQSMGQVNLKVGYNVSYQDLDATHQALDVANASFEGLEEEYRNMKIMNGLELGVHYELFDVIGLEATWINGSTRKSTLAGTFNGEFVEDQVRMTMSEYSLAAETMFGNIGFGASYGIRRYKHKGKIGTSNFIDLNESTVPSSRFYLVFKFKSENSAFAMKPYYQFPYERINISNFNTQVNSTRPVLFEDPISFGISFVFYNGPQN